MPHPAGGSYSRIPVTVTILAQKIDATLGWTKNMPRLYFNQKTFFYKHRKHGNISIFRELKLIYIECGSPRRPSLSSSPASVENVPCLPPRLKLYPVKAPPAPPAPTEIFPRSRAGIAVTALVAMMEQIIHYSNFNMKSQYFANIGRTANESCGLLIMNTLQQPASKGYLYPLVRDGIRKLFNWIV